MKHKTLEMQKTAVKFDGDNPRVFEGYASVFGAVDSYGDRIAPGAYAETLKEENRNGRAVKLRWNHYGPVIGKFLEIREDDVGLYVRGELTPNHSIASDVAASMQHKAVDGLSIGYILPDDGYEMDGAVRVLKKIKLIEISVVEEPAETLARVSGFKSALENAEKLKDVERVLRDAYSLTQIDAKALVSRVKSILHRDGESLEDTSDIKSLLSKRIEVLKNVSGNDRA